MSQSDVHKYIESLQSSMASRAELVSFDASKDVRPGKNEEAAGIYDINSGQGGPMPAKIMCYTNRDENLHLIIKELYEKSRLTYDLHRILRNSAEVCHVLKLTKSADFECALDNTYFIFDYEFVRKYYANMPFDKRIAIIKHMITDPKIALSLYCLQKHCFMCQEYICLTSLCLLTQ